ncbi:MAG: cytochrome P450 [Enhygromyxa sp.]
MVSPTSSHRSAALPPSAPRPPRAPGAAPLLGHLPMLRKLGLLPALEQLHAELGDVFTLRLGPRSMIVVAGPEGMERIFVSKVRNYTKHRAYAPIREFLGDGLVTLEGDPWRVRRRLIQPHFHRARLEQMVEGMVEVIDAWLADLRRRLPSGGVIDIHREMVALTLDIVFNALFGPGLARGGEVRYEVLSDSIQVMNERVEGVPVPLWIPTARNRRFKRTLAELDANVFAIIAAARRRAEPIPTLLGMLLETVDDQTGEPLPDRAIRDEVMTLYVAGHETTALMLTWLFALTGERSDVWGGIEDELHRTLGGRVPRFAELPGLVYLRAVIDETLRMRPAVAALSRDVVADDELMGYRLEAGEFVLPYFFGLHHHPDLWDEPRRFDPGRFAPEAQSASARHKWSYMPFAAGPRMCIGNNFALAEGALIISMLLQRAEWTLEPGQQIEPVAAGTVRPSAPVNVRVRWK